jgi:hypothetical protein
LLEAFSGLRPIFFEKWDLRHVKARIPKLRIDPCRFGQCGFSLIVVALPHEDDAAQVFRRGKIGLARVNGVELF